MYVDISKSQVVFKLVVIHFDTHESNIYVHDRAILNMYNSVSTVCTHISIYKYIAINKK